MHGAPTIIMMMMHRNLAIHSIHLQRQINGNTHRIIVRHHANALNWKTVQQSRFKYVPHQSHWPPILWRTFAKSRVVSLAMIRTFVVRHHRHRQHSTFYRVAFVIWPVNGHGFGRRMTNPPIAIYSIASADRVIWTHGIISIFCDRMISIHSLRNHFTIPIHAKFISSTLKIHTHFAIVRQVFPPISTLHHIFNMSNRSKSPRTQPTTIMCRCHRSWQRTQIHIRIHIHTCIHTRQISIRTVWTRTQPLCSQVDRTQQLIQYQHFHPAHRNSRLKSWTW